MTYHFFGGKGGVGKTTCAAAVGLAQARSRVLIVSTDPAHSLADALAVPLGATPRAVGGASVQALELDADRVLRRWLRARRARLETIALRGTYLDDDDVGRLFDLSLPGVDELLALSELTRLARAGRFDEVIVDTAPTGHTLRLLETPATLEGVASLLDQMQAKHRVIAESLGGICRPDACDALIAELQAEASELAGLLRDPERVRLTWVLLPEMLAVEESNDALATLERLGIRVGEIVVNRVTPPPALSAVEGPDPPCALCGGRRAAERAALEKLEVGRRAIRYLPALEHEPRGRAALRRFGRLLLSRDRGTRLMASAATAGQTRRRVHLASPATAATGVDSLEAVSQPMWGPPSGGPQGRRSRPFQVLKPVVESASPIFSLTTPSSLRLLLFMGKGGVGKTTCAAAAALRLAQDAPARRILLLSTDPAPSLGDVFGVPIGDREVAVDPRLPQLRARELDAIRRFREERERYRQAADELLMSDTLRGESRFDATIDRQVVRNLLDLAPPGLDELMAMLTIVEVLRGRESFSSDALGKKTPDPDLIIVDTAPTGHAMRLLAMPAAAHAWVQALLGLVRKYRGAVRSRLLAEELIRLAAGLRELRALLTDSGRARAIVVTRPAEVPVAETRRLLTGMRRLRLTCHAIVANAVTPPPLLAGSERIGECARCRRARTRERQWLDELGRTARRLRPRCGIIVAPAVAPPPRGRAALVDWSHLWAPED